MLAEIRRLLKPDSRLLVSGPLMPVVYDTPWAGLIDTLGGLSLGVYARLSRWKREVALRRPDESTGWRAVARRAR